MKLKILDEPVICIVRQPGKRPWMVRVTAFDDGAAEVSDVTGWPNARRLKVPRHDVFTGDDVLYEKLVGAFMLDDKKRLAELWQEGQRWEPAQSD